MSNGSVERVQPAQILEGTGDVEPGTWAQRAGMRLAIGVGALACLVTIVILANWYRMLPVLPHIDSSTSPEASQTAISNYKALSLEARETAVQLFDAFVLRAILPVFTTIVGFIFGVQASSGEK